MKMRTVSMITNQQSGTNIVEVAADIYRVNTPITNVQGGFSFNQYLIVDENPLLFHTGPRRLFPVVAEAVGKVLPAGRLRYIALSHVEANECGSLNEWLTAAPGSVPVCGAIAALVSISDLADRPPRPLAAGERLELGKHTVQWFETPHLPHAWDCGFLADIQTRTLFCGDLFTQPGPGDPAVATSDILGPSEEFRRALDYYSHTCNGSALLAKLAAFKPTTLACMHGSAWTGDGAALLTDLAASLERA
jgi:flavorubredoxin